uniref:Uncharacterized protein n=1 Tax=Glossina brevipalpis TaxID=37001 RepID=A0A1A9WHL3_9MUSC
MTTELLHIDDDLAKVSLPNSINEKTGAQSQSSHRRALENDHHTRRIINNNGPPEESDFNVFNAERKKLKNNKLLRNSISFAFKTPMNGAFFITLLCQYFLLISEITAMSLAFAMLLKAINNALALLEIDVLSLLENC